MNDSAGFGDVQVAGPTVPKAPGLGGGLVEHPAIRLLAVCVSVFLFSWLSHKLGRSADNPSPIWLPGAIWLTFLLKAPRRAWPALILAGLAGNLGAGLLDGRSLALAIGFSLAKAGSVAACAAGVAWALRGEIRVGRPRDLLIFCLIAAASAALAETASAAWVTAVKGGYSPTHWLICTVADALGFMLLTPPLLVLSEGGLSDLVRPGQLRRAGMVLAVMTGAIVAAAVLPQHPLILLAPPVLILAAVQLEFAGAALCMLIVMAATIAFVPLGWIPFAMNGHSTVEQLLMLQGFLLFSAIMTFPVAAILASRREIEAKLLESRDIAEEANRRARMAESLAGVGYWRVAAGTQQFEWSDQMYAIYGRDQSLGPPDLSITLQQVHPDDRQRLATHREEHSQSDSTEIGTRLVLPDGEVRHIIARSTVDRDEAGQITARFGTCIDVTEIKLAQAAAEESERRYRFLADNAPDMICRTSVAGGVFYVSPSSERVFGYTAEEMFHQNAQEMVHPEDFERVMTGIFRLVEERLERLPEPLCYRAKHKNGEWVWIEANPTLIFDEHGEPLEFIDIVRNVTQTKLFEAELDEARRRAEAAVVAKSAFLANMSHELRTPLTSIIGFSRLMGDRTELPEETKQFAKRISDASEALASIINDVLDFSKLEAGQVALETQPFSVRRLVEETTGLIAIQTAAKGLELHTELGTDLPDQVDGDVSRLRQVLLNFLSNAVKFTDAGCVTVKVDYDGDAGRMRVGVSDTGQGISDEGKARLFERFSQAEVSINRTHGGTGLGLAISKGIVELMGGQIGVDTEIGQGSTFWFEIPAPVAVAADVQLDDAVDVDCPPLRVLMVDDTAVNRELVKLMLTPLGLQITEAGGGAEGIQIALAESFDLILMDVRMPGVDGLEATRVIRGSSGVNCRTPILALTADVQPENAAACRGAGMNDVLAKPISPSQLLTKVVQWGAPMAEARAEDAATTGTDG